MVALLLLDTRTQTVVQVIVSIMLGIVMTVAWRTQKTYPGFGRWTASKLPHALGWLLVGLRGLIPDWASVFVANGLIFLAPLLLYEGIRQFRGKPHHSRLNYALMVILLGVFIYCTWLHPNVNVRLLTITAFTALVIARCAYFLIVDVPSELHPSFWFTAIMFGLYDLVLLLRVVTAASLLALNSPFSADVWQSLVFLATIVMPIGWTFGFFMMTNDRLTLELHQAEHELRGMAATDFLTGALNRRSFLEMSQRELLRATQDGQSMLLLIFDIDHFKEFNDTYGHLAGDDMLCGIVATCRLYLRKVDLLERWGGDEFVILLPNTDQAGGLFVAEKLRRAVAELSLPSGNASGQAYITISVGCALWLPGEEREAVLRRADHALYQAKERGRNCVVI
jgi:diguanylate cyclase (GGDEF)-like protein